jgi:simple sugar transport system ATP-binding protein
MNTNAVLRPSARPIVELVGITKTFGKHKALDSVNLRIMPQEVLGLLGDNGAGKSTLVKLLSGVVFADAGEVLQDNVVVRLASHADADALGIGTIYQDNALVDAMSIYRNIFLAQEETSRFGFLRRQAMRDKAMEILRSTIEISGMEDVDKSVSALSGGQKQAIAIARAVHFRKRIVIFDEPTSALSIRETDNVLRSMERLREENISSVFVTHNLHHAMQVCDRFVVMERGRKILDVARSETSIEELTAVIIGHGAQGA